MRILLLDIETAPHRVYVWGLFNQNVAINQIEEPGYTLSWAAKWYGQAETMFGSIYHDGKREMLRRIYELVDEADVVIHYYGTHFDIPTLNQEWLLAGFKPPSPVIQIDLLNTVRKRFKFPSRKLSYVGEALGLGGKVKHKGMELWRDCMAGDKDAWETMKAYNIRDVDLLEDVYEFVLPWIPNHPNYGLFHEEAAHTCPNCGGFHLQRRGHYYTKTLRYQRWSCNDCGAWSRERLTDLDVDKRRTIMVGVH